MKPIPPLTIKQMDRFNSLINHGKKTECWLWKGLPDYYGYGQISFKKQKYKPHRIALFLATGNPGECTCHKCNNRLCCNPNHLYAGTYASNHKDAQDAGTLPKGEIHKSSKLTNKQITKIIELASKGLIQKEIGRIFNVSRATIGCILRGKTWSSISGIKYQKCGYLRGSKHPHSKLTEIQILEIIKLQKSKLTQEQLATRYHVGRFAIQKILTGKTWQWLTNR